MTAAHAANRKGLLLINLGTPDAPETGPVRTYLREFLSDPRVIDLPAPLRWMLLNLVILPTRPSKSAEAYRKVWTAQGSPLLVHSKDLVARVSEALAGEYEVELGMRYGNPSIASALQKLYARGVRELTVFPLYPQNASSSTGSSLERVYEEVGREWDLLPLKVVPPFYDDARFLDAFAAVGKPVLDAFRPDHVLFSYHGLPERHLTKGDRSGATCQFNSVCCASITPQNAGCYRAQTYATTRGIASRLGLSAEQHSVSFQSRLGRTPWIRPYTDLVIPELVKQGVKRLAVFCPAFVADCLETLEEIGIRAREDFKAHGGEELVLVPSLNVHPEWVSAVTSMARGA